MRELEDKEREHSHWVFRIIVNNTDEYISVANYNGLEGGRKRYLHVKL